MPCLTLVVSPVWPIIWSFTPQKKKELVELSVLLRKSSHLTSDKSEEALLPNSVSVLVLTLLATIFQTADIKKPWFMI